MKPSGYLLRQMAAQKAEEDRLILFTLQMACDAAAFAANDTFGAGPERCPKFIESMQKHFHKIAELTQEDGKADKHIEYTKATVDEGLRRILGDKAQPWEKRYAG